MFNFKDFSHLDQKKDTEESSHSKILDTFLQITYYSEINSFLYSERIEYSELEEMKLKKNVVIEELERVQVSKENSNFHEIKDNLVKKLYDTRSEK